MRNYIIEYGYYPCMTIASHQPGNKPQCGSKERQPVAHDYQVRPCAPQPQADGEPVERIDGIDGTRYGNTLRGITMIILRLARKEE